MEFSDKTGVVEKLSVEGRDDRDTKLDTLDLLGDDLRYVTEVKLAKEGRSNAETASCLSAIKQVYRDNKKEIQNGKTIMDEDIEQ